MLGIPILEARPWLLSKRVKLFSREETQIIQSLFGSNLPGDTFGNAGSAANTVATNCAAQYSLVKMTKKRLTFSGSIMNPLMLRALFFHEP